MLCNICKLAVQVYISLCFSLCNVVLEASFAKTSSLGE
jgi:hypothetical protein